MYFRLTKSFVALAIFAAVGAVGSDVLATASQTPAVTGKKVGAQGSVSREGVTISFEARPLDGREALVEGGDADIRFSVTDATSGQPVPGLAPGAWLDLGQVIAGKDGEQKSCKDKIALYLKGVVGIRPMLDLNGYYMLVLNKGASITVIDPVVSVGGRTSTLTTIVLKKPPMDWTRSTDGKRLFVSMPVAGQVAVVDTDRFKVEADVDAGKNPVRVALQPDGRRLWVGNNGRGSDSGVTVIDAQTLKRVAFLGAGDGHHEIAFSGDSRHAFVTSRDAGTVTVFDTASLRPVATLKTGERPISIAWSVSAEAAYVADGRTGTVGVIDGRTLTLRKSIVTKPGLGPLRFAPDGRHAFVLNTVEHTVTVIDAATDEIVHKLDVAAEPFQVVFTRAFAYIRGLATEKVTMVNLGSVGRGQKPIVQTFAAGEVAPRAAGDLPIADSMAQAKNDAAIFTVSPSNNTVYFYMEGMNAPMSGYTNRGFEARAVTVVDRSLRETAPGVFGTRVRFPSPGQYDVAFMLDRPRVLHCFSAEVKEDPAQAQKGARPRASVSLVRAVVGQGDQATVRVQLREGRDDRPKSGVEDVTLRYFRAPSEAARTVVAKGVGDGVYEAIIDARDSGAYYIHVLVPSLKIGASDQAFATLRVNPAKPK